MIRQRLTDQVDDGRPNPRTVDAHPRPARQLTTHNHRHQVTHDLGVTRPKWPSTYLHNVISIDRFAPAVRLRLTISTDQPPAAHHTHGCEINMRAEIQADQVVRPHVTTTVGNVIHEETLNRVVTENTVVTVEKHILKLLHVNAFAKGRTLLLKRRRRDPHTIRRPRVDLLPRAV